MSHSQFALRRASLITVGIVAAALLGAGCGKGGANEPAISSGASTPPPAAVAAPATTTPTAAPSADAERYRQLQQQNPSAKPYAR